MKQLTLIRHAKSSWSDDALSDFDRPLNDRGKRDAPLMGERLALKNCLPDLILSSPAKRARKTAKIIAEAIGYFSEDIVYDDKLYLAEPSDLVYSILAHGEDADHIMIFGHNPGITVFSNELTPTYIDNVPTCGIIWIQFEVDRWKRIEEVPGALYDFDYPKRKV